MHLEPLDEPRGEAAERRSARAAGSSSTQLLDGVGDAGPDRARRGSRSTVGTGFGAAAREEAGPEPIGRDAREQVGREAEEALLETGGAGVRAARLVGEARCKHRGDVLERLALEQAGQQQVALLPERQLLVEVDVVAPGSRRRAFSSTSVAAMRRNSVAIVEVEARVRMRSSSAR